MGRDVGLWELGEFRLVGLVFTLLPHDMDVWRFWGEKGFWEV